MDYREKIISEINVTVKNRGLDSKEFSREQLSNLSFDELKALSMRILKEK